MATTKNATRVKEDTKQIKEYKIIGDKFKDKTKANEVLKQVFSKGFKGTGLMIQENGFVILFGTYATEQIAKANLAVVQKAGFTAEIVEQ